MTDIPRSVNEKPKPRKGWFFNPYFQLLLSIILAAAAQLFLKIADRHVSGLWMGVQVLDNGWGWSGIAALVASLFSWLYSLQFVALNVAANLAGLIQVLVPLGAWLLLGERIGPTRAIGIALVCAGVFIVVRPVMRLEEKL